METNLSLFCSSPLGEGGRVSVRCHTIYRFSVLMAPLKQFTINQRSEALHTIDMYNGPLMKTK